MKLKHTFTKPKKKKKKIKLKKNKKVEFTKLLQLIHLRFGGSFMRPLIIFSFLSSSFLLPISEIPNQKHRNPRNCKRNQSERKEKSQIFEFRNRDRKFSTTENRETVVAAFDLGFWGFLNWRKVEEDEERKNAL